ncbi:tetratricopeptide repeat protein [Streptomyces sp. NPDC005263]|uniref:tetratricopeptide repeat protein n=1 Tax=Streptomyces sp. NPDC005263 TaxID=3364711 RepID=UPI0036AFF98F
MSRFSRDKKRDQQRDHQRDHQGAPQRAGRPAASAVPIDVRVPGDAGPGCASVGGVGVVAAPGEEIQQTVLNHLHRIARATGHTVLATIHDTRIGYVVPLRVAPDGSSGFSSEPVRMGAAGERDERAEREGTERAEGPAEPAASGSAPLRSPVWPEAPATMDTDWPEPAPDMPAPPLPPAPPVVPVQPQWAQYDSPTDLPPEVPEPERDEAPTFRMRALSVDAVPDGTTPDDEAEPTFTLRALPRPQAQTSTPGTVTAPTGVFGPPPVMDASPTPPAPAPEHGPTPTPVSAPTPTPSRAPLLAPEPTDDLGLDPAPKPTPPRGFDAVAEAVLGDGPLTAPGDDAAPALLAEPMGRINEEVKAGRTDAAAQLAERTVAQASQTLGPEHPEVLRLRELTAYIAYLADDPVRAFRLSLDLAHVHHRAQDAEAAYGNVQSAFTAWRAVRDPREGLDLGHALIALWTELASEEGPAADDAEQLEKAHARMGRLTDRAGDSG